MKNIKTAILKGYLQKDTIRSQLLEAYGCENDGVIVELGNQYRESIEKFVENIFGDIVDRNWLDEGVFTGFRLMDYSIMRSLRDTGEELIIELE